MAKGEFYFLFAKHLKTDAEDMSSRPAAPRSAGAGASGAGLPGSPHTFLAESQYNMTNQSQMFHNFKILPVRPENLPDLEVDIFCRSAPHAAGAPRAAKRTWQRAMAGLSRCSPVHRVPEHIVISSSSDPTTGWPFGLDPSFRS